MNTKSLHPDWIVPDWPAPPNVHAVFTTRAGGVSLPPYDSLNLGRPSDDDRAAVDTNRERLAGALGVAPVYISQVHGTVALELTSLAGAAFANALEGDACVSAVPGVVCTMRVADCLPVLFTNRAGTVVGAAHAGWRGLVGGVLESNVRAFRSLCQRLAIGTGPHGTASPIAQDVLAWLGPCIGPHAFEVGPEVREAFLAHDSRAESCFIPQPQGKWLADLPSLARLRLRALGIQALYGNDGGTAWCTVANPSRFFSHRRDSITLGGSGRMAACIWLG